MRAGLRLALTAGLAAVVSTPIFVGEAAFAGRNRGNKVIKSISPSAGETITTCSVAVEIRVSSNSQTGTLVATLNGEPLVLSGGPTVFTATVDPGPPLVENNLLDVTVQNNGGNSFTKQSNFQYLPPRALARQIVDPADCIQGPLAHCRVGDWLLQNADARFVVQDAGQRELHSVGQYGGNLIDAELVVNGVRQGNDNFFELQPSPNIETVINAQTVEIVNDGQDCTAAIVRSCGPDDLIDYVNPSSVIEGAGGSFPPGVDDQDYDIEGCTDYSLEPGNTYVEVTTTVESMESVDVPLYIGDYINGAGELEQWVSPVANNRDLGIGETVATFGNNVFTYFGFDDAEGVSYAYVNPVLPLPSPFSPVASSSFTQSGVSFILHLHSIPSVLFFGAPANFVVPAGGTLSFVRQFVVGRGSGADAIDAQIAIDSSEAGRLTGCVTLGGVPAPGARVSAGVDNAGGGSAVQVVRSTWVTDASGCYEGKLPVGSYAVAAAKEGALYEGGGGTPLLHTVSISDGVTTVRDFALPATGRLLVEVADGFGSPSPARLSVVGFDPSPESELRTSLISTLDTLTGTFNDITRDPVPAGLTRTEYVGASGVLEIDLEPGDYQVAVSRGTEYSLFKQPVTIVAGTTTTVNAQVVRVLDTSGFISSDYHVHMINSPDSRISLRNRALSFAGEGVDNMIASDHDAVTNPNPTIAALGFAPVLHATQGEEITTFDTGHFNAYPQGQDPSRPQTAGSTDWAGAAPPGRDFPSFGHYILTPAEIELEALSDPSNAGFATVVQINHIGSHFTPLKIDTSHEPPASQLGPGEPEIFRLDPAVSNYFHPYRALELWNGSSNGAQNSFLNARIGIWMNLLNQGVDGIYPTAIADTDTHTYHDLETAGARSWTPSSFASPADVVTAQDSVDFDNEIGLAVQAGKLVGGQGAYVQTDLFAASTGQSADFSLGTATLVETNDGTVELTIRVQAPDWAPYDTIEIYQNATTTVTGTNGGTAVAFSAIPSQTLTRDLVDGPTTFTVSTVPVNGSQRLETTKSVTLSVGSVDTWVVVVVKGTPGNSAPMFPVYPRNTSLAENPTLADLMNVQAGEAGVRALGFTNALFVDGDSTPGFDPPGVQVAP